MNKLITYQTGAHTHDEFEIMTETTAIRRSVNALANIRSCNVDSDRMAGRFAAVGAWPGVKLPIPTKHEQWAYIAINQYHGIRR